MWMGRAMALRRNRFLFSATNASSSSCGNLEFCQPPFPPSPPPPAPIQEPSTTVRFRHSTLLPSLPIAAASLLAAAAFLLLVTFFFLRRCRRRRAAADEEQFGASEDGVGGVEIDHHVWYIRTTGLDESTIRAVTAWAYKADDGVLGESPADCAVCLSELRDGELVRLLPKCGHAFHLTCVDTWLRSHVNCPLCRAPVVFPTSVSIDSEPGASTLPSFSSALSSPDSALDSVPSALEDSHQNDGQQLDTGQGALEVESEGDSLEFGAGNRIMIDQIPTFELQVPSDVREQGFQPIRRSFSMDSFTLPHPMHRPDLEEGLSDHTKEPALREVLDVRTWRKEGNTSGGTASLQKEIEISSSSASGKFFLSRHLRARSSVLPL
nr:PREDICTED: RING-H2 finger protein ATL52-like [Musa acuminata subsp. malaccensis]